MAAELAGQPLSDEAALQALAKVGLSRQCDLAVRSLSQGQKKRAALAKLLALPRPLWLLDEPFVALDTQAQDQLGGWISQQLSSGGSDFDFAPNTPHGYFTSHRAGSCP
jgi:heme exporter protein A